MISWIRFVVSVLAGIVAGAVAVTGLTILAYALLDPDAFRDGQFALIFFITVPFGGFLGGMVGVALSLLRAGSVAVASYLFMAGGAVNAGLLLLLTWFFWGLSGSVADFLRALASPALWVPIATSLAVLWYGALLPSRGNGA